MTDTSGPTSGTPFAQYDPGSSYWRTSEATSLWALTLSSLTLPPWGCLRGGELCERPTPGPLTTGPASSSLPTPVADNSRGLPNGGDFQSLPNAVLRLPTPRAQNGEPRNQTIYERPPDQPQNLENALALLPTPRAAEAEHPGRVTVNHSGQTGLAETINALALLPTPVVNDMGSGKTQEWWDDWTEKIGGHGKSLEQEALRLGETTGPRSSDGSRSSEGPHQPPLFGEETGTA